MRTLFVGAGGVGGYFAAKLLTAGLDVTVQARGVHLEAIRKSGLTMTGIESFSVMPWTELKPPYDVVVLGVKMQDLESFLPDLPGFCGPHTTVVTLQNGLEAEEKVSRVIPASQIVSCISYIDSYLEGPGVIRVLRSGRLRIGGSLQTEKWRLDQVDEIFSKGLVPIEHSADLLRDKWSKLCWNAIFNPLCAITRRSVGEIKEHPGLIDLGRSILAECYEVARATGIELNRNMPVSLFEKPPGRSEITHTSMGADLKAGKATEIEFLNGVVVRKGAAAGVPTPINSMIVAIVLSLKT